jgi:hypothetical protein
MTRMGFREVVRLDEFERDLRRLQKRFETLEEDLETLVGASLFAFHKLGQNTGVVPIGGLGPTRLPVFKVRKFACRSLPGRGARTGLRLIHAYDATDDRLELIEIYFKGDQANEDRERIRKYYSATGR